MDLLIACLIIFVLGFRAGQKHAQHRFLQVARKVDEHYYLIERRTP